MKQRRIHLSDKTQTYFQNIQEYLNIVLPYQNNTTCVQINHKDASLECCSLIGWNINNNTGNPD